MIDSAAKVMESAARAFADKGKKMWTTEMHSAAAGLAISKVQAEQAEGPLDAGALGALFHALYNHSAWRQKFTKLGIFAESAKRVSSLGGLLDELNEEGV